VVGDPQLLARGEQQVGLDIPSLRLIDAKDSLEITEGEVLHLSITIDGLADAPMNAASAAGGASSIKGLKKRWSFPVMTASTELSLCRSTKNRCIWAAMIFPTNWVMQVIFSN
jgi:hypothetical protein